MFPRNFRCCFWIEGLNDHPLNSVSQVCGGSSINRRFVTHNLEVDYEKGDVKGWEVFRLTYKVDKKSQLKTSLLLVLLLGPGTLSVTRM